MSILNVPLNDEVLVDFLLDHYKEISFISKKTKEQYIVKIKEIISTPEGREEFKKEGLKRIFNPSNEDSLDVLDFWERLIIDSLKFLKWHDTDEFPLPEEERISIPVNEKEEVYDKISEGSLGVYNLKEYFKAFVEFERLLYGAEQFYRDHVFHIIRVWLIGQYILSNMEEPIDVFDSNKINSKSSHVLLSSGEQDSIWCLIALTHDLGYPLAKIEKINISLKKMMQYFVKSGLEEFSFAFPQQNQFINDAILRYISSKIVIKKRKDNGEEAIHYNTHIQAKYYLKFSRSFERFDHGLISCIVLVKNLVYFLETNFDWDPTDSLKSDNEARQFIIRREILRSIASHTCPEIYHIKPNTFYFLLSFADEIQFWGRPTFESMASGIDKDCEVILKEFSPTKVSFKIVCESKPGQNKDSLINFFMEKAALYKKILRVAVKASDRKFTLNFIVVDETGTKYEFTAAPNDRPTMTINGTPINHIDLKKLAPVHEKGVVKEADLIKKYS